ncbi:MAG: 2-oxoglutarate ferredoxin oxidoreductase subunit alpha [Acidimicrobiales bacterium]|nr:MAG: 2-oxoglutarate ferredoxin oxidoreductase subunit alpha [Acidimicrobiales bacterium]
MADTAQRTRPVRTIDRVVILFAGDSGDGMQLAGNRFTSASAVAGNDLATLPEFPAEIRAPAGTLAGVSSFQVAISDHDITTPGDTADVLVAMNPAALKAELPRVREGGTVIVNEDAFTERNLAKAGYDKNPLEDGTLSGYRVYRVPMSKLTREAVAPLGVKPRDAERSKNFFALGLLSWMYSRPEEVTLRWIEAKFAGKPDVIAANKAAFKAGHAFGETAELFEYRHKVEPAPLPPGVYTNITGNTALSWGIVAAGQLAQLPVFLGSYPITPASDILHELARLKHFGVRTLQAEDEIAAVGAALGASYGGHLAFTTTSGPGMALKSETVGLAVSLELPLVVVDVQRGGPSTGLPTKTEQADLLMAMFGRHGEAPLPILAARSPSDCFDAVIVAARTALRYRTPVILLSDGYLANSSEPWRIPDVDSLEPIEVDFASEPNGVDAEGRPTFHPYVRDPETLARRWAIPGTPGLMHRIGGLEKEDVTGNVSYDPDNHEKMVRLRKQRIDGIVRDIPPTEVRGDREDPELLVVGWGSTWGAICGAVDRVRSRGRRVAQVHLRWLNPLPADLGEILRSAPRVVVPEMNLGQLALLLRARYLVDVRSVTKVKGVPFSAGELERAFLEAIDG